MAPDSNYDDALAAVLAQKELLATLQWHIELIKTLAHRAAHQ